ncbi:MAG: hypothetical protein IKD27_09385 [Oscillospiraceae bacterium]|nr:hypothetical protein [Oscillospiraceae bacterium]
MKQFVSLALTLVLMGGVLTGCACSANVSDHPGGMITEETHVRPHPTETHETSRPTETTRPRETTMPTLPMTEPTAPSSTPSGEGSMPTDTTGSTRNRSMPAR